MNGNEPNINSLVLAIVYAGIELIKYFTAGRKINLNTDRIEEILTSLKNGNSKN